MSQKNTFGILTLVFVMLRQFHSTLRMRRFKFAHFQLQKRLKHITIKTKRLEVWMMFLVLSLWIQWKPLFRMLYWIIFQGTISLVLKTQIIWLKKKKTFILTFSKLNKAFELCCMIIFRLNWLFCQIYASKLKKPMKLFKFVCKNLKNWKNCQ